MTLLAHNHPLFTTPDSMPRALPDYEPTEAMAF